MLVVNKPAGQVTHPPTNTPSRHAGRQPSLHDNWPARRGPPWLLHRLDRDTSGVLLFAKTELARRALVRQFEQRTIRKQLSRRGGWPA